MIKNKFSILLSAVLVFIGFIAPVQQVQAANVTHTSAIVSNATTQTSYTTDADYAAATQWAASSDYSRLAYVLNKAQRGEKITVVTLGGSVTQGVISPAQNEIADTNAKPYATIVKDWFKNKFPDTKIKFINAGVGGTGSYYGVHRLDRDVLVYNPDLVFVEFAVNDYPESYFDAMSYENLVRRLLEHNQNLAVVLLFTQTTEGGTAQGYQSAIGANFHVPMISYGNAMNVAIEKEGRKASDFSGDKTHPSILGHAFYGELICRNLEQIYSLRDNLGVTSPFNYDLLTYEAYDDAKTIPWPEIGKVSSDNVMKFGTDASEIGIYWDLTDMSVATEFDVYIDDKFAKTITFDYDTIAHTGGFNQLYYGQDDYHVVELRPKYNAETYTIGINQVFICHE